MKIKESYSLKKDLPLDVIALVVKYISNGKLRMDWKNL